MWYNQMSNLKEKKHCGRSRCCGTKDPPLVKKQEVMRALKRRKRTDDEVKGEVVLHTSNKKMRIGIVFHIGYTENKSAAALDITEAVRVLNNEFNMQSDRFDGGREIYEGTCYEALYDDYVSRAGSLNIEFYVHDTRYVALPIIVDSDNMTVEQNIKNVISPVVDPARYLNVWIVPCINDGTLGWATFPWDAGMGHTDGIIISKDCFGVNLADQFISGNGTLVHEIGHWCGCFHTFQETDAGADWYDTGAIDIDNNGKLDEDEITGDCCPDTPYESRPVFMESYPTKWSYSRARGKKHYVMFMNQMAYTGDQIRWMFTKDQCTKMRLFLDRFRPLAVRYV